MKGAKLIVIVLVCAALLIGIIYAFQNVLLGPKIATGQPIPAPNERKVSAQCGDGQDNDGDGKKDLLDLDCDSLSDNDENSICNEPRWVKTGDPYFGEIPNRANWRWIVNNIYRRNWATQIVSPTEINGPTIGVASAFTAENLNQDVLPNVEEQIDNLPSPSDYRQVRGWSLPNDYEKLIYAYGTRGRNNVDSSQYAKITTEFIEDFDTSNARNVPANMQDYLKLDSNVVKISTENAANIPGLFLSGQHTFVNNEASFASANYQGQWPGDYSYYTLSLKEIKENGDVILQIGYSEYTNGQEHYEPNFATRYIPYRTEQNILGTKIYNFASNVGNCDNHENEEHCIGYWAILYVYQENEERTVVTPAFNIYFQPFLDPFGEKRFIPFYKNPDTGELEYAEQGLTPQHQFLNQISFRNIYYDTSYYVYASTDPFLERFGFNQNFVLNSEEIAYYSHSGLHDNILNIFKLNENGQVISLGEQSQVPENNEFQYYNYNENTNSWLNTVELGTKTGKHKTFYGTIVESPQTNGQNDKTIFYLPSSKEYAGISLAKPVWGWSHRTWTSYVELGENIFTTSEPVYWGLPWNLDYEFPSFASEPNRNYLNLQHHEIPYNNQQIEIHEAIVSGTNTPRVQTSLTSLDDSYQENVYVETLPSADSLAWRNDGIKYIYAFDDQVDLVPLNENAPLRTEFLGDLLTFLDYRRTGDQDELLVQRCRNVTLPPPPPVCETDKDCYDGAFCTTDRCVDTPQGKACQFNLDVCAEDDLTCTQDYCNEETDQCVFDSSRCCTRHEDCEGSENSNFCGGIFCNNMTGEPLGFCENYVTNCNDGIQCTIDSCNAGERRCDHEILGTCPCQTDADCPVGCCQRTNHQCGACD